MNSFNREISYDDGSSNIVTISSTDDYKLNMSSNYVLANKKIKASKFKNSIFGCDIGVNSKGFASVATLATLIAIINFILMIISFRI